MLPSCAANKIEGGAIAMAILPLNREPFHKDSFDENNIGQ